MIRLLAIAFMFMPALACAGEIIDPSVGPTNEGAPVSIERDGHLGTNGRPAYIFVDGKAIATVKGNEAIVIRLAPGPHIMGATLRSNPDKPDHSIAVEVKAEATTMLKAHLGNWGWSGMELQRVN